MSDSPSYGKVPFIKFSGTVTLGHILQLIGMLAAGIFFALRLEARIDVSDVRINDVEVRVDHELATFNSSVSRIDNSLMIIQQQLATKVDRDMQR